MKELTVSLNRFSVTSVAFIALQYNCNATIHHVTTKVFTLDPDNSSSKLWDFDQDLDHDNDIGFLQWTASGAVYAKKAGLETAAVIVDGTQVKSFNQGTTASASDGQGWGVGTTAYFMKGNGAFIGSGKYFAIKFYGGNTGSEKVMYGWVHVSNVTGNKITMDEWAWDDTGGAIRIGAVPEPETIGALAGGAAAIIALRRRRKLKKGNVVEVS